VVSTATSGRKPAMHTAAARGERGALTNPQVAMAPSECPSMYTRARSIG